MNLKKIRTMNSDEFNKSYVDHDKYLIPRLSCYFKISYFNYVFKNKFDKFVCGGGTR